MCQIIFLVGVSYLGYQLRYFTFQYSLSLPTRAGFQQLRERASALTIIEVCLSDIIREIQQIRIRINTFSLKF